MKKLKNLKFEHYRPGYENEQVKIAKEVRKTWPWPRPLSISTLEKAYNQPDFDPSLNLYCFSNSTMIGFVIAEKISWNDDSPDIYLDFPYFLPEIDIRDEIENLLYNKIIKILKDKGFKTIETAATTNAENNFDLALKRGFQEIKGEELGSKIYLTYQIRQNTIGPCQENVREFDLSTDLELCAKQKEIFLKTVNKVSIITWAKKSFEEIKKEMQNERRPFFANLVISNNNELFAHCCAVRNRYNQKICAIGYLFVKNEYYLAQIIAGLISICKAKKIEVLLIDLMGQNLIYDKACVKLGFQNVCSWAGMKLKLE